VSRRSFVVTGGGRVAADLAEQRAPLVGWIDNAAIFRDASVHVDDVLPLVQRNLAPAVVGSAEAVRRFLNRGGGAIVNVSPTSPVDGGRAAYGVDPEARDVV
jgi:hypothetical protein